METIIDDLSIKGLSMRIVNEIQKEDWNYRYLAEHFLVMGLRLPSMTEDYKEVAGLAKKWGYLLSSQYESDPMEWADLAGEIGEMKDVINNIRCTAKNV